MTSRMYTRVVILITSIIPFVFFAMLRDYQHHSILYHIIYLLLSVILAILVANLYTFFLLLLWNVLSGVSSYVCVTIFLSSPESGYFKPLTTTGASVFFAIFYFVVQIIVFLVALQIKKKRMSL